MNIEAVGESFSEEFGIPAFIAASDNFSQLPPFRISTSYVYNELLVNPRKCTSLEGLEEWATAFKHIFLTPLSNAFKIGKTCRFVVDNSHYYFCSRERFFKVISYFLQFSHL